jgi:hypothetical protein
MAFIVARTIIIPTWDETIRSRAKAFWTNKHIAFTEESEYLLAGRRGNRICNLVSYDPTKLVATLTITSLERSKIDCVLAVNTSFQLMTDWVKALLELEMATFESYLLDDDPKEELWKRFLKSYNIANLKWTVTCGILGTKMASAEKSEFKI